MKVLCKKTYKVIFSDKTNEYFFKDEFYDIINKDEYLYTILDCKNEIFFVSKEYFTDNFYTEKETLVILRTLKLKKCDDRWNKRITQ